MTRNQYPHIGSKLPALRQAILTKRPLVPRTLHLGEGRHAGVEFGYGKGLPRGGIDPNIVLLRGRWNKQNGQGQQSRKLPSAAAAAAAAVMALIAESKT